MSSDYRNRAQGALTGLAIGGAFGAPVEFMDNGSFPKVEKYLSGGSFGLSKGEWTDDTSHMLALMDSLCEEKGFVADDFRDKLFSWLFDGAYTTRGRQIGAGKLTMKSLFHHRTKKTIISPFNLDKHSGNGSVMRLAPIPVFYYKQGLDIVLQKSAESSMVTHSSELCLQSCKYLGGVIHQLLSGVKKDHLFDVVKELTHDFDKEFNKLRRLNIEELDLSNSGYCIHSLESAMHAFLTTNSFLDGLVQVVNNGKDSDTVGAIYGQIAGAFYGYSQIPQELVAGLMKNNEIKASIDNLISSSL